MDDAHQFALVMFVLACAAATLLSGQLYMEHNATTASATKPLQRTSLSISSLARAKIGTGTGFFVTRDRP